MHKVILVGTLLGSAVLGQADATSLRPYSNPRFEYAVDVPRELVALPPPDNGDGQAWQSKDGRVQVSAWGSYGPDVLSIPRLQDYAAYSEKNDRENGSRVTYRKLLTGGFVLSGYTKDGRIFYRKTLVDSGTEATVEIIYPVNQKAVWDGRVAEIARSLRWP